MIKLSRLADYGIVILCEMAAGQADLYSARSLSEKTTISEPTIMKILKLLVKAGVVSSVRGPKGGYALKGNEQKITVLDVVQAIDGPVAITLCSEHSADACNYESQCIARGGWHQVNEAIKQKLAEFSISDFMAANLIGSPRDATKMVSVSAK